MRTVFVFSLALAVTSSANAADLMAPSLEPPGAADKQSFLDALWMSGDQGLTDVVPFVYLLLLAWLAITGPGARSAWMPSSPVGFDPSERRRRAPRSASRLLRPFPAGEDGHDRRGIGRSPAE
jgi:hypothetical protein